MEQSFDSIFGRNPEYRTPYGDLTKLNTNRLILDSVGKKTLKAIAEDAINLLGTSIAVYEKNGDYAFGMFSSGWCRLLDDASRKLCATENNHKALTCGKWLCHECCWNDSAKPAIETGKSTDIDCIGGIKMYAEPIFAGDRIVGAINFGYGTPPRDPDKIRELAELYQLSEDDLSRTAETYAPRPQFMIDLAKKRLYMSARLIGEIVAKYQAEKALHQERDLLESIFEEGPFCTVIVDNTGTIISANKMSEKILGENRNRIYGRKYNSGQWRIHDLERNSFPESELPFNVVMRTKQPVYNVEHIIRRPDGTNAILNINGTPLTDGSGAIQSIVFVIQDITEHKWAMRELKEQKDFLHILMHTIPLPMFYKIKNGPYIGCNRAFEEFFGILKNDLLGNTEGDLQEKYNIRPMLENDDVAVSPDGTRSEKEITNNREETRNVILQTALFDYSASENVGILGIISDVTQQKKNEKEIAAAHRKLKQIIESLSSILIGLDREMRIKYWNSQAEKTFNINFADVADKDIFTLKATQCCEKIQTGIKQCAKELQPVHLADIRYTRADGADGYLGMTINPVLNAGNEFDGIIIIGNDLTSHKILESQLAQAQKLEAVGQLAAGIAHEINTPTQYVGDNIGFIEDAFKDIFEILQPLSAQNEPNDPEKAAQTMDTLNKMIRDADVEFLMQEIPLSIKQSKEGIQRVAEIVKSMKQFAHPGGDEKSPLDINQAVQDTILVCRNEWKYHSNVQTDLDPELPPVSCYQGEIKQVLLNIIVNAAQAIEDSLETEGDKKGTILVQTRKDGDWAEIKIADDGPGMPPEVKDRVFDPFFTTKEVGKGTGQGLNLAYRTVVQKHQGSLWVESQEGQGAAFIIRLPLI
jgi:PAS domain S-box-containing protein